METPEQITKFLVGKSEKEVTKLLKFFERESLHERLDGEELAAEQAKQIASESTDDLVGRLSGLRDRGDRKERAAVDAELGKRDQEIAKEVMVKKIFNSINSGSTNMNSLNFEAQANGYKGNLVQLVNDVQRIMIEQEAEANA